MILARSLLQRPDCFAINATASEQVEPLSSQYGALALVFILVVVLVFSYMAISRVSAQEPLAPRISAPNRSRT